MSRRVTTGLAVAAVGAVAGAQFAMRPRWRGVASSPRQLIEGWARHPLIPGVILRMVRDGSVAYEGAAGHTTLLPSRRLTPETLYHVASIGKLFTAVAALRLWERGLLDLDAPVHEHIDPASLVGHVVVEGIDLGRDITARHLLSHTAGLANTDTSLRFQASVFLRPHERRTPEQLLHRARRLTAVGRPGERQNYASPGYYLLGRVLESMTGLPYHCVIREEILSPLDLRSTWESNVEWRRLTDELHHYLGLVDLWRVDPSFEYADGGFVSTAADLTRFGQALMDGTVFQLPTTLEEMCRRPFTREPVPAQEYIGLGVHVSQDVHGRRLLSHQGFWGTGLVMRPDDRLVMAYAVGQANAAFDEFQAAALDLATLSPRP